MKNRQLVKKFFLLTFSLLLLSASKNVLAENKNKQWFEPEIIDHFFDSTAGTKLGKIFVDNRIGVKKISGFDDILDKSGEISPFDFELGFTTSS